MLSLIPAPTPESKSALVLHSPKAQTQHSLSLSLLKLPRCTNNENFLDHLHKFVCLYSFYCLFAFINICGGNGYDTVDYETMAIRWWVSLFEEFFLGLNRLCSSLFFIILCGFDGGWTILFLGKMWCFIRVIVLVACS